MSIWAIGDIQGCHSSLQQLLNHSEIANDKNARFWFCGDLVNRGPDSLAVLDTIMAMGEKAITVLGNHDLHLLGMVAGLRKPGRLDTLDEILNSPKLSIYVDWLRSRPLAHLEDKHLLVHAGVWPGWSAQDVINMSKQVQLRLQSHDWQEQIKNMYGNTPVLWDENLDADQQFRFTVNSLTRMRMLHNDGSLDFEHKGEPIYKNDFKPWFSMPNRKAQDTTIVFGHWSALGLYVQPNLIGLDTGCIWGKHLTALRLHDRKFIQVQCDKTV